MANDVHRLVTEVTTDVTFQRFLSCGGALTFVAAGLLFQVQGVASPKETTDRLETAATVFSEIMHTPDKGIPDDLLESAQCVVIIPGFKKGAFFISGQYGKGFMTCRKPVGWSAPAAVRAEGGGFGLQFGGSESDLVLLVMNRRGADRLMSSQFTLGADGSVAAGPVGRTATAQTDAKLSAEILSWSRSRGVFAGIALNGATLRSDEGDNADLYGSKMSTKEVIDGSVPAPAAARPLIDRLDRYSPKKEHR